MGKSVMTSSSSHKDIGLWQRLYCNQGHVTRQSIDYCSVITGTPSPPPLFFSSFLSRACLSGLFKTVLCMNTFVWFCLKVTGASESVFGIFQADQAQIIDRISHKLFFEVLVRDYWQDSEG